MGASASAAATTAALLCGLALLALTTDGFLLPQPVAPTRLSASSAASATSSNGAPTQATLDSRTPWQLSLTLTREGFDPVRGELRLRFVENKGYEPPQVGV